MCFGGGGGGNPNIGGGGGGTYVLLKSLVYGGFGTYSTDFSILVYFTTGFDS